MKLKNLVEFSNGKLIGDFNLELDISKFSIDSRVVDDKTFFIPLKGENSDGHDYIDSAIQNGVIGFFTSRDVKKIPGKIIIKVEDTLKAMQDLARNFRVQTKDIPLVAITGSVGKTTTKDMVYAMLQTKFNTLRTKGNFNNDIGMPLTLINYENEDIIVLEMGMNHLGEISFLSNIAKPDVSVITNVGHSHIGNLGSRENILKAKLEILDGMDDDGVLIINGDNDMLATVKNTKQKIITFGFENDTDVYAYNIRVEEDCTLFNIKEDEKEYEVKLSLVGEKFIYNALAAWIIGKIYDVPAGDRIIALSNCEFTKMRMNIKRKDGITIIDDSYNASPKSMKLALEALSKQEAKRKIAILGDMLELGEYSEKLHTKVGEDAQSFGIDKLFTVGKNAKNIAQGAINKGMAKENVISFETLEELIDNLKSQIAEDDAILVKASRAMGFEKIVEKIMC